MITRRAHFLLEHLNQDGVDALLVSCLVLWLADSSSRDTFGSSIGSGPKVEGFGTTSAMGARTQAASKFRNRCSSDSETFTPETTWATAVIVWSGAADACLVPVMEYSLLPSFAPFVPGTAMAPGKLGDDGAFCDDGRLGFGAAVLTIDVSGDGRPAAFFFSGNPSPTSTSLRATAMVITMKCEYGLIAASHHTLKTGSTHLYCRRLLPFRSSWMNELPSSCHVVKHSLSLD